MSSSCVNLVILIGNLGADPIEDRTSGGKAVVKFPLATTKTGRVTRTTWHNVVAWGAVAATCRGLRKGQVVYLEGEIDNYRRPDGGHGSQVVAQLVREIDGARAGVASSPSNDATPVGTPRR